MSRGSTAYRDHARAFPACSGRSGHIPEESGHRDVCRVMLQLLSMYAGLLGPRNHHVHKVIPEVLCSY